MQSEILQRARGVRDFGPAEKILRNKIVKVLQEVFELYGYNPIETPIIERYELFASKFGAGEESDAMRETFKFADQGDRQLVLRTEFTVPFARFVGMNPQLRFPFKRYQMGQVFRDGPIKLGRYREFWQCDVDVVGINNPLIDAELIQLAKNAFERLGLQIVIKINNRKILNKIISYSGVSEELQKSVIISIDKLDKIGELGVKAELLEKMISEQSIDTILSVISVKGTNQEIINRLKEILGDEDEGLREIEKTINTVIDGENLYFTPSLARGLSYYTGNVFEYYLADSSQISSSIAAGGRFDNMIGGFLDDKDAYPAIGMSFGLDTIFDALTLKQSEGQSERSVVKSYLVYLDEKFQSNAYKYSYELRKNGINLDIDFLSRKLGKNLEFANSYGIDWVIILGEDEVAQGKLALKNMQTGEQTVMTLEESIAKIQKRG